MDVAAAVDAVCTEIITRDLSCLELDSMLISRSSVCLLDEGCPRTDFLSSPHVFISVPGLSSQIIPKSSTFRDGRIVQREDASNRVAEIWADRRFRTG